MANWLESLVAFAQNVFPLAVVLLAAYLGYLVDRRAKREQFERERKYDRKQLAYESALGAIRRSNGAIGFVNLADPMSLTDKVAETIHRDQAKRVAAVVYFLGGLVMLLESGDEKTARKWLDDIPEGISVEDLASVSQTRGKEIIFAGFRMVTTSRHDLDQSLATLSLLNAPSGLIEDMRKLMDDITSSIWQGVRSDGLEERIAKVEDRARSDLEQTLRPRRWLGKVPAPRGAG